MKLSEALKNLTYTISNITCDDGDLLARLHALGFTPGTQLMIKRWAPIFRDPILVQLGDSQIAISKTEAQMILLNKDEAIC